jgi:CubicO group peptidase (beta-lactamase class C family)
MNRLIIIFLTALASLTAPFAAGQDLTNSNGLRFNRNFCITEEQKIQPELSDLKNAFVSCHQRRFSENGRLIVPASADPMPLVFDAKPDPFVNEQLQETGLLSYLLYRNGKVVTDAITPKDRLGDVFDDKTLFHSASIGKSFTSYLLGHAICRGKIPSLDHTIADWPLLQNTLYERQTLRDLVNMNIGDSKYFNSQRVLFENPLNKKGVNHATIKYFGQSLQNTRPPFFKAFNYSQMVSASITNYVAFKMGDDFQSLLEEVYTQKARISLPLEVGYVDPLSDAEDGRFSSTVWASRYDYLRIAVSMLDDWRNDTCVGKYLKELYRNQVRGNPDAQNGHGLFRRHHKYGASYKYAGFFHTSMARAKGTVFGMAGFGGQFIFINFDNGTIVVTNAVHDNFDTSKLIVDAINE